MPGFVNAHYHSHDVLLKGCFETIPLELWVLSALPPSYPKRSTAEIRARTLLGAIECLRSGITTVQDLATIYPFDEEHLEAMLQAYEDVGIRCVFALQIADRSGVKSIPFWDEVVPPDQRGALSGSVEPFKDVDLPTLLRDIVKSRRDGIPASPGRSVRRARNAARAGLLSSARRTFRRARSCRSTPTSTKSKAMTLIARQTHGKDGGSLINYLKRVGLLSPRAEPRPQRLDVATEIDTIAEAGTNVVLNPVGNLKTRSGVAPIRSYVRKGVNVGLGCDNCSCSDAQNMFQSMKMFAALAAVSDPEPGRRPPPTRSGRRRSAAPVRRDLQDRIGALQPGMAADLSIIDLTDPSFVPLNSVARQLVFTEGGRGRGDRHCRRARGGARPQNHHHRRTRAARGGRRPHEGAAQGHRGGQRATTP